MTNIYHKTLIIAGPTSSGKTSLALRLCEQLKAQVISADSRQIIKGLDIGTGKQPVGYTRTLVKADGYWDFNGKRVWGYDLAKIDGAFSSYDFALFAGAKIRELAKQGINSIIAGGTGFYIDVLTGRIAIDSPSPDSQIREHLNTLALEALCLELKNRAPTVYAKIDINNRVRVQRALEKVLSYDQPDSQVVDNARNGLTILPEDSCVWVGLTAPKEFLYGRVGAWAETVWSTGLVEETKRFIDKGYKNNARLNGLIYKTVIQYLNKELTENDAIQRIKYDLHAYIRRQLTWFRRDKNIIWLDISQNTPEELEQKVFQIYTEAL